MNVWQFRHILSQYVVNNVNVFNIITGVMMLKTHVLENYVFILVFKCFIRKLHYKPTQHDTDNADDTFVVKPNGNSLCIITIHPSYKSYHVSNV